MQGMRGIRTACRFKRHDNSSLIKMNEDLRYHRTCGLFVLPCNGTSMMSVSATNRWSVEIENFASFDYHFVYSLWTWKDTCPQHGHQTKAWTDPDTSPQRTGFTPFDPTDFEQSPLLSISHQSYLPERQSQQTSSDPESRQMRSLESSLPRLPGG